MEEKLYDEQNVRGGFRDALTRLSELPEDAKGILREDWYGPTDSTPKEALDKIMNLNVDGRGGLGPNSRYASASRYQVWRKEDGREFHRAIFRWQAGWMGFCYQAEFTVPSGSFKHD